MPFVLTIKGGTGISSPPDVCKVPSPGGPIPCPFVNIVSLAMADPSTVCKKVMVCKSPAFTVETTFILSQGDEGGPLGGVMSGKFIGP
ncbi:MAG: DUF4150 domain-containing protein, partial [Deltaproteobacteria bacterium]|nr:DUF4150 domain-containing protein [Deltaproteobacteria bacterium]